MRKKKWKKVTFSGAEGLAEWLPAVLVEQGATGIEEQGDAIIAYFSEDTSLSRIREILDRFCKNLFLPEILISISEIEEQNWQENWKQYFKPVLVRNKLVVKPSWEPFVSVAGQLVIEIDPGQAFGTGTHATTYLMLDALLSISVKDQLVIDVGTGTGILAIAAAKLGAAEVCAFDIDPVAVAIASDNSRKNGVGERIHFFTGQISALSFSYKADMLLANITTSVLIPLVNDFAHLVKENGHLLFSGILVEEEEKMNREVRAAGLQVVQRLRRDEWIGLICQKEEANG